MGCDIEDFRNWLVSHDLEDLVEPLIAEDVDLKTIASLNEADMKEIGLSLGKRKQLLKAIESLSPQVEKGSAENDKPDADEGRIPSPQAEARSAERRQLTVMFCDVAGSTALSEVLDPEDLRDLMLAYQQVCLEAIQQFGGHLAKYLGDGVLAYFGYPTAHEDDPSRSVRAGLALLSSVRDLNVKLRKEMDLEIGVRIGVHTGLVVAGEMGAGDVRETDAIVGETPNIAARLEGLAASGGMVIGPVTRRLLGDGFECTFLGEKSVKGISTPLAVYSVEAERSASETLMRAASRPQSQLVGRSSEIRQLNDLWRAVCDGTGQLAFISGEAGVGKSRLSSELVRQISDKNYPVIGLQGSPLYKDSPLFPLKTCIQTLAGIDQRADPEDRLETLESWLSSHEISLDTSIPALLDLLSLTGKGRYQPLTGSPQFKRRIIQAVLTKVIAAQAGGHPLLLLVEDAHWIDPTTLDWVGQFLSADTAPTSFVMVASRPHFHNPWAGEDNVSEFALGQLSKAAATEVIRDVFKGKELPATVISQLLEKADGVPLFVEEMSKSVRDSGALLERKTEYVLSGDVGLAIPTTLQDLLTARLDQLDLGKAVAQIGSAIGRDFERSMIEPISTMGSDTLVKAFRQLAASDLVDIESSSHDETFSFRHALMRDAAYDSMLKSRRLILHKKIGDLIDVRYQEIALSEPAIIADHRQKAGQFAEAIPHWQRAARAALDKGANVEAINQLRKALICVEERPEGVEAKKQELDLQCMIGPSLMATKGWAASEPHQAFQRARTLCEEVGDHRQSFAALWGIWLFHAAGSDLENGLLLVDELFQIVDQQDDEALELQAHHAAWGTRCWFGDMDVAIGHVERGLELYDPKRHRDHAARYGGHDPGVCAHAQGALTIWYRGYPDLALQRAKRGVEFARELNHPASIGHAQLWLCNLLYQRLERLELAEAAATLKHIAREHALGSYFGQAALFSTWATTPEIGVDAAINAYQESLRQSQGQSQMALDVFRYLMLAEATLAAGHLEEATENVAKAFDMIDAPEPHVLTSDLLRLKSAIERAKPDGNQALAHQFLRESLGVAKKQNARSLELRAAVDLARLLAHEGDSLSARDVLFPIHDWFTEGFDTVDWQAARVLRMEIEAGKTISFNRI